MPQQIQHADESAALATAQQWIGRGRERCEDKSFPFYGFAPLDPEAGLAALRRELKQYCRFGGLLRMAEVCGYARRGSAEADQALRELIAELRERGDSVPTPLRAYEMELLDANRLPPHRVKGQKKSAHLIRDLFIAGLVGELISRHGLKPTRRQTTQPSACSIVARALDEIGLGFGEKAVEKIWERKQWIIGDYRRHLSVRN